MLQRLKVSWQLFESSVEALLKNPKLLLFPMVSFCATMVVVFFFLGAFLFQPTGHSYTQGAHWKSVASSVFTAESLEASSNREPGSKHELQLNPNGVFLSAMVYFLAMFLATFFNVAFCHEIMEALHGRPISIRQGLGFAVHKIIPILMWSLLAGAVGYLIKQLEQRFGLFGKIVVNLIGLAWSMAAIFAIPVIVCERDTANPFAVLHSSASAIKKTWGESLIGFVGLQLAVFLTLLFSAAVAGMVVMAGQAMGSLAVMTLAVIGFMIYVILFGYFASVTSNVLQSALYVYASTGQVPNGYSREMLDLAWKHKA